MEENNVETKKEVCCPKCKCKNIKFAALQKKSTACRILFLISASVLLFIISLNLHIFGLTEDSSAANLKNSSNIETLAGGLDAPPGLGENNNPYDEDAAAGTAIIIFSLACIVIKIIQYALESKVHVQGICKDCHHTWTIASTSLFDFE